MAHGLHCPRAYGIFQTRDRTVKTSPAKVPRLSLRPLLQAVISLMEMGFDEKEVIDALRVSNNQQNAAVSTACGLGTRGCGHLPAQAAPLLLRCNNRVDGSNSVQTLKY